MSQTKMPAERQNRIYSATYSNVPVYEYSVGGNHVMRRRSDDWINATHILKVADYDKPARTRILEREVQKGTHEKVQGGYGKYQGTWVPLPEGRNLAERNGILDKLAPIFDYTPGDRSPPPAPKHATAASNRPKVPRAPAQPRRVAVPQQRSQMSDVSYDNFSVHENHEATPDNGTFASDSDEDMLQNSQFSTGSRKRKRAPTMSYEDQQHVIWSDDLLDYFMLLDTEDAAPEPPVPNPCINLNRPIDEKGHTAMHWAAAMGDINVVKDLIRRGARIDAVATNGETPLIRAILFTNNYDKQTFGKLIHIFQSTVAATDWFGSTVFHHIAMTTSSKSKYTCARYYLDTIMEKLAETYAAHQITRLLDLQDQNGDTAITLAARHGARKCVRSLLFRGAAVDIPNNKGETADELIRALNSRLRDRHRHASSSPFQPQGSGSGPVALHAHASSSSLPLFSAPATASQSHPLSYRSEAAHLLSSQLPHLIASRAAALAAALEAELADRDAESQDADRVLAQRGADLAALRKSNDRLAATQRPAAATTYNEDEADDTTKQQQATLDALAHETSRLLELEQAADLAALVLAEAAKASHKTLSPSSSSSCSSSSPPRPASPSEVEEALALARRLHASQQHRLALIDALVSAHSTAGLSDRQALYKRLIAGALGVGATDVEALLPEILADLEELEAADPAAAGSVGPAAAAMDVDVSGSGDVRRPAQQRHMMSAPVGVIG